LLLRGSGAPTSAPHAESVSTKVTEIPSTIRFICRSKQTDPALADYSRSTPITPDTKNWTWVLERPCGECGFDSSAVAFADVPDLVRSNAISWAEVLERENVTERPDSETWSALEYSAHVRDVFRIFKVRLEQMLEFDDPQFENWDQDATAEAERYNDQDPATVASELSDAAAEVANAFETVPEGSRQRRGLRSDGSAFTVESLAAYFIHDPIHHLHDVSA
jgi:hypothetical protein